MDLNEKFNIEILKMNSGFKKLHEDYNIALYNGAKYQDSDFLQHGISDFFQNLNNVIKGYMKGYDNIIRSHTTMVTNLLSNDNNRLIMKNKSIISERPIKHPFETSGYIYNIDIMSTLDTSVLNELLDLDKMLSSISSYSSGEISQNYNFEFLPNFNRPTWIAKILGVDTPLSDKDFTTVAYMALRNGKTSPVIIEVNNTVAKETLEMYLKNPSSLKIVQSLWNIIYSICERLITIINRHKSRLENIYKNAPKEFDDRDSITGLSTTDQLVIFMDKLKKAAVTIDDILNIYSRIIKMTCYALVSKIQQEQYILVTVIQEDRSKE